MPEPGEELVGTWLRYIEGCDFVDYNVVVPKGQGEIDVVGIKLDGRRAFICEVASHTGGLGYKNPVTVLTDKFERAFQYARARLAGFDHTYMFWCPIVRSGNQKIAVEAAVTAAREAHGVDVVVIDNKRFVDEIARLRAEATKETRNSPHPVMRLMQIEEMAKDYSS